MKMLFTAGSGFTRLMFWELLVLISISSLVPGPEGEMLLPHQDKVFHAVAYISLL